MNCVWTPLDRLTGRPTGHKIEFEEHQIKRDVDGPYCVRCGKRFSD